VIHAVGPVWSGGGRGESELLASCYRSSLALARGVGARSLAFPAISTGVYRFPKELAARIAIGTTREWLAEERAALAVTYCCFGVADGELYRRLLVDRR
jgi:O-acetyl-ADP-ribose deacetylase (regulator of RNase III)